MEDIGLEALHEELKLIFQNYLKQVEIDSYTPPIITVEQPFLTVSGFKDEKEIHLKYYYQNLFQLHRDGDLENCISRDIDRLIKK